MAENKTQPTETSPHAFLETVTSEVRRRDGETLLAVMARLSGEPAVMWGGSMIGFGRYHYRYDSGREGDFFRLGFAPRKSNLSIYIVPGFDDYGDLLKDLGPHKTSVSCLYIKRLADIDMPALEALIARAWADMARRYPAA